MQVVGGGPGPPPPIRPTCELYLRLRWTCSLLLMFSGNSSSSQGLTFHPFTPKHSSSTREAWTDPLIDQWIDQSELPPSAHAHKFLPEPRRTGSAPAGGTELLTSVHSASSRLSARRRVQVRVRFHMSPLRFRVSPGNHRDTSGSPQWKEPKKSRADPACGPADIQRSRAWVRLS